MTQNSDRCTALDRRPSVVEAEPGATVVTIEIDRTRHRLAPCEARALACALLAGALMANLRFDLAGLNSGDEVAGVL